ncbi:MAG: hypothetical protein H6644_20900 [Caldilineaceae bacterium]|nr:hypothetical protein [Caldilineaceae bacterium]
MARSVGCGMGGKPFSGANAFVQRGGGFHGWNIQFFGKQLTTERVLFECGVALSAVGEEQHTLTMGFFAPRFQRQQELVERQSLLIFAMLLMQTDAQVQSLHEEIVQMAPLGRNLPFENRGIVERETVEILSGIEFKRFIQHKRFVRHRGGRGRCVHEGDGGKIASKSRRVDPVGEIVAEGDGFSGDIRYSPTICADPATRVAGDCWPSAPETSFQRRSARKSAPTVAAAM